MFELSSRHAPVADPRLEVMDTLSRLMPWVEPFWRRPLVDYARAVYDVDGFSSQSQARSHAMTLLRDCIERAAIRSGHSREDAIEAGRQLIDAPVIQTGPHCHLLVAPDAFYTHLFCVMGLKAHGRRWHIHHSDITVKFVEKAKKGPGWLHLDGEPVNVFGLSRSKMMPFNICGRNGPYRFALSSAGPAGAVNRASERLKAVLPDTEYPSAAEAIKAANRLLWKRWFDPSIRLLQFDDFDIADLIADHLRDDRSWLATRFVGDATLASDILETMRGLDAGPWTGWIKATTHFFWGLRDGRIFPLLLRNGHLEEDGPAGFKVAFQHDALCHALQERQLVPNMFTSFLVTSILPGARVLGGSRQTIYYPLMRYVLARAMEKQLRASDPLLDQMRGDVRPGVWGHRVLAPSRSDTFVEIEASPQGAGLADLLQRYGALPLAQSCGHMTSFTEDEIWSTLAASLASGDAGLGSPEWQWA